MNIRGINDSISVSPQIKLQGRPMA